MNNIKIKFCKCNLDLLRHDLIILYLSCCKPQPLAIQVVILKTWSKYNEYWSITDFKNIEQGNCGTLTFNETLFMKRINWETFKENCKCNFLPRIKWPLMFRDRKCYFYLTSCVRTERSFKLKLMLSQIIFIFNAFVYIVVYLIRLVYTTRVIKLNLKDCWWKKYD